MDYYQVVDDDVPPSKRPRTLNEQTPTPMPIPTTTAPLFPPPTDPHSIGRNASATMFFKTRLCQRFSRGSCPYGDRCTFAHGLAELRPSLSNWQDMTAGIPQPPPPPPPNATATKICWVFQSRGACSYGEHCTFRHVADAGVAYDGLHHHRDGNGPHSGPPDGPAPLPRKPCFEWQSKGRCPYGDRCVFSHEAAVAGAGIQKAGDHAELNSGSGGVAAPWRPIREAADEPETEFEFEAEPEAAPVPPVRGRGFQKMLKKKKIAGIYGDSLDEE